MKTNTFTNQLTKRCFLAVCLLLLSLSAVSQNTTIKNGPSWVDTDGNTIHAHGVGIIQVGSIYYMIGEDRRGGWDFKGVNMYSSPDLVNWTFENTIISDETHPGLADKSRFIERPKIIYNPQTQEYVVWVHWEGHNYGVAEGAVFKSSVITGDYTFVRSMRPNGKMARDCNLFIDDDGTAYFIASGDENVTLYLHELTPDYLDITGNFWQLFPNERREAPVIFKENGIYYMLASGLSGWAPNQGTYATASSITGPWSGLSNLGDNKTYNTQPAHIIQVPKSGGGNTWIYIGDRWQDPNLVMSKNIMMPLRVGNGMVSLDYTHEWSIDLNTGNWRIEKSKTPLDKSSWSIVSVSSEETSGEDGRAVNAIDGNENTIWHSQWSGASSTLPQEMVVDMGQSNAINGFGYVPRLDGSTNGLVQNFLLYVSDDVNNWGDPVAGGWMSLQADIAFSAKTGRYAKFVALSSFDDSNFASMAEFDLYTNCGCSEVPKFNYEVGGVEQLNQSVNGPISITLDEGQGLKLTVDEAHNFGSSVWINASGNVADYSQEYDYGGVREYDFNGFAGDEAGKYVIAYLDEYHCSSVGVYNVASTGVCDTDPFLTPYYSVNGGEWVGSESIQAYKGDEIKIGPQVYTSGTWSWMGCDISGNDREKVFLANESCTVEAKFTNECGESSILAFDITVSPSPSDYSGAYRIITRNSGKALSVLGDATINGAHVVQRTKEEISDELWDVEKTNSGNYRIKHIDSNKYLSIDGASINEGDSSVIWEWKAPESSDQLWRIIDQGEGMYHIQNINSKLLLDVKWGSSDEDIDIIQWSGNGGYNQDWVLESTTLGVEDVQYSDNNLKVYPNPASDFLNINIKNIGASDKATLKVFNLLGIEIISMDINLNKIMPLNVSELTNGLYLLQIKSNSYSYFKKFLVK